MKLNALKFALAGGIYLAACAALATIAALLGIPGFPEFTGFLVNVYGFYGYSVSWLGVIVGAFWGFVEGFVHIGIFAWIYNLLTKQKSPTKTALPRWGCFILQFNGDFILKPNKNDEKRN